jgi:hypothetical protein
MATHAAFSISSKRESIQPGGWYRRPADAPDWKKIWISPWWNQEHRDLDYINEPFNNPEDLEHWRSLGYTQTRFTGDLYDMRFPEPAWVTPFRETLPLANFAWAVYRMRPGDTLPEHHDIYARFRKIYDLGDDVIIRRYVIFLEDWQQGHYFDINRTPILGWCAGTAILWNEDTRHTAANVGKTNRYTLQITGTVSPDNHDWRLTHANDSIFK